jgi:hypothetical protein
MPASVAQTSDVSAVGRRLRTWQHTRRSCNIRPPYFTIFGTSGGLSRRLAPHLAAFYSRPQKAFCLPNALPPCRGFGGLSHISEEDVSPLSLPW